MTSPASADDGRPRGSGDYDLYAPGRGFPRLTTPQWVGEEGVQAVAVLGIDDMRDPAKYEAVLRPVLTRLKAIDGRAPVSVLTNQVRPDDPRLQGWLDEGLSLECHTADHPCPLLQADLAKARSTYEWCVDQLSQVPRNRPVAYRMPCCDSLNTVSPRFFSEIFARTTAAGNFLSIDTSVFTVLTPDDPELPRELVSDPDGRPRFPKYLSKPLERNGQMFDGFVNTIEDYPYPYVIDRICWEFPCIVPSDWEAQHLRGPNHPDTVADMKAALDAVVLKQGVFCLVFHPHGWIRPEQVVELVDHAAVRHGGKVKFLTFREALDRLNRHLLDGHPVRGEDGSDAGVRVLDVDSDGFMDVATTGGASPQTRLWNPVSRTWRTLEFPAAGAAMPQFVSLPQADGSRSAVAAFPDGRCFRFAGASWEEASALPPAPGDRQAGSARPRSRDLDHDGTAELILTGKDADHVYGWRAAQGRWWRLPFGLPEGVRVVGPEGRDAGVRFADLDGDGNEDLVASDAERYAVYRFTGFETGWGELLLRGVRGERPAAEELPPIVGADGSDNGLFVRGGHLFWQNEDTAGLKDLVDRRAFKDLLRVRSSPE